MNHLKNVWNNIYSCFLMCLIKAISNGRLIKHALNVHWEWWRPDQDITLQLLSCLWQCRVHHPEATAGCRGTHHISCAGWSIGPYLAWQPHIKVPFPWASAASSDCIRGVKVTQSSRAFGSNASRNSWYARLFILKKVDHSPVLHLEH